jgi:hypothetical protein
LLDRLENDRSLARFAGQFVPLKIVTDGNPEWSKWASKYPIDGRGIPRLYVVRADGEKLFGAVGSLPGDQLPQMMLAALNQAGRSLSDAQAEVLAQAVDVAQQGLDDGEFLASAHALSAASPIGSPDELGSYAEPAVRAGETYEQLQAEIDLKVEQAREKLLASDNDDPLDALLVICEAEAAYQLFPKLKSKAGSITRDLKKNKSLSEPLAQAEALVKARSLKSAQKLSVRGRAVNAYAAVIRRYPGSRADEIARAELASIDPDAKVLHSTMENPESTTSEHSPSFRQWTARSGKFKTKAKYIQQKSGKVQLLKEDGQTIVVDISVLSDEDQAFLRQADIPEGF